MIFKQYYLGCLAHASYLVGDEEARVAVVVDPQRDIEQYLQDAEELGVRISHVILTHFHADFVAGHVELRDRVGARIHLGRRAQADYDFSPLREGDVLQLGPRVRLEVLETPGHTPEGVSILVYDLDRDAAKPHAVLTGDTLFIGDVGRPDLMASQGVSSAELASMLYDSLHGKLLQLPDETLVYPAHGAGSMCGKNLSKDTFSTLGTQRRYNYALQPMSRDEFVKLVTADQQEPPQYFAFDAELNRRQRPTLDQALERALHPLQLDDVLLAQQAGAQLLDVRDPADFAGAHLANSINIGLGGQFATWCGTLLDRERPIVLVAEPGREQEAAMRLGRIGLDHVRGYLEGGMLALDARPELLHRTERVTAATLAEQLASNDPPFVLDVRAEREYADMHIEGATLIPLPKLRERLRELPRDRRIAVHCAGGYRSSMAASILAQNDITNVEDLVGGIGAWEKAAALPVVRST